MPAFGAVLVCDDIRRDTSNKDIIIGVYSADIVMSSVPHWMTIAFYLEYLPSETGEQLVELRFGLTHMGLVAVNIKIDAFDLAPVSMPVTGLQMLIDREGELLIEASFDSKKTWQELKRKKIKVGQLPAATPLPTLSSGLAGNS
jgi:hypothetical protein